MVVVAEVDFVDAVAELAVVSVGKVLVEEYFVVVVNVE